MSEAAAVEERMEEQVGAYAGDGLGDPAVEPSAPAEAETSAVAENPAETGTSAVTEAPAETGTSAVTEAPAETGTSAVTEAPAVTGTQAETSRPGAPAANVLKGRIRVADEVVEKVAALAALEIPGVADLGGDLERAFESVRDRIGVGTKRATQGVRATIKDQQVSVDVTIVIVYGHVVMDVATEVKVNVARSVSRMLGMLVVEVNVTVDDVRLPGDTDGAPA
ncbi:Asp23/Gls24 family envelope stress response protein [Microbispora sp. H11081]|uniref:Asp23/Gls24 family envelope stress response protein n=1 Tax=Microbispora sp. H11081 TaxID=2729107 RepID=UPI0014766970|nr:Asp23/Gls24 family envelope stress response protein [Microbispora sp. H11081]